MDQISEVKISLGELMEEYSKKRKEYLEEGGSYILSRLMKVKFLLVIKKLFNLNCLRFMKVKLNYNYLLDQEFSFQKKMHEAIRGIFKENKLENSQLEKFSHALKTLTIKYSAENTTFTIFILIFSFIISLLRQPLICNEMFWVFGCATLFLLILKIWINETVTV